MKSESIIAGVIGIAGIGLFTVLLVCNYITPGIYLGLIIPLALVCIAVLCLPRLQELDLKNLRLVLSEMKQVKKEIVEMYGGIERLKRTPLVLDDKKMKELGLNPSHLPQTSAVMRYTAGCIKRERERLARVFINEKSLEETAQAILDNSLDEMVFKWCGPETGLDSPPVPVKLEKEKAKEGS